MKKLNKTQEQIISTLKIETESEYVQNPYSGKRVLLEPKAVALYDFIKGCEILQGTKLFRLKEFDQARYAFQMLWPDEYMTLLD